MNPDLRLALAPWDDEKTSPSTPEAIELQAAEALVPIDVDEEFLRQEALALMDREGLRLTFLGALERVTKRFAP